MVRISAWPKRMPRHVREPAPNGNTVSIEYELVRQADAKRQFDLSLSVYQSGLSLLRTSLGRR